MSEPVIISSFNPGIHNADLKKTVSRLDKELNWKDLSTIMITPAGGTKADEELLNLLRKELGREPSEEIKEKLRRAGGIHPRVNAAWENMIIPPNNRFVRLTTIDCEVGEAYSRCIEAILANPALSTWKYVLTREHDNAMPPDGFIMLARAMEEHPEFSAISGGYFTKGPGGCFQGWGNPSEMPMNFRPQLPRMDGGLLEVNGTGMGFTLFRLSMFKDERLRRPWFKTVSNSKDGVGTQDLYFAGDARKHGYRFAVHCGCRVGHHDSATDIMW